MCQHKCKSHKSHKCKCHCKCHTKKPNVILFLMDDWARANMGAYGDPYIQQVVIDGVQGGTNNVDELYNEGVRMQDFHVAPICTPTRASLMTGKYALKTNGIVQWGVSEPLRIDEKTMGNIFKKNGYQTGMTGKWGLGAAPGFFPQDRGFDDTLSMYANVTSFTTESWNFDYIYNYDLFDSNGNLINFQGDLDGNGFVEETLADFTINFIEKNKDKPFFFYYNSIAPHWPMRCPPKYRDAYKNIGVRGADNLNRQETTVLDSVNFGKDAEYYGMISYIDHQIGRIRNKLKELHLEKDTIILFVTDNGLDETQTFDDVCLDLGPFENYRGSPPLRGLKDSPYEGGHRAAGIWHWPKGGLVGGRDIDTVGAHIDILPTLKDLCKLKTCVKFDGKSLASTLKTNNNIDRTVVIDNSGIVRPQGLSLAEYQQVIKGVRVCVMKNDGVHNWRLVNPKTGPGLDIWELYELNSDPSQLVDVAGDNPLVVDELLAAYDLYWDETSAVQDPEDLFDRGLYQLGTTNKEWHLTSNYWDVAIFKGGILSNFNFIPSHTNGGGDALPTDHMNIPFPFAPPFLSPLVPEIACSISNLGPEARRGYFTFPADTSSPFMPNSAHIHRVEVVNTGSYRFALRRWDKTRSYTNPISVDPNLPDDPGNPNSKEHFNWLFPFNEQTPIVFKEYYTNAIIKMRDQSGVLLKEWQKPIITGTEEVVFNVTLTTPGKVSFEFIFERQGNDPFTDQPLTNRDAPYIYITYLGNI